MRIPKFLYALIAGGALVWSTASADAALTLRLTQGGTVVEIEDQDVGPPTDANPAVGAVTFVGPVGVFDINVSTGLSKPEIPNTSTSAGMDLNSVNSSDAAGTLVIELTDTDFTLDSASTWSSLLAFGGTTEGSIQFDFYLGLDNLAFETDVLLASSGPHSTLGDAIAFADLISNSGIDDLSGLFSLTMIATITHGSGEGLTTSFNGDGSIGVDVPTPGTLSLFLAGITALGFGAYNARKRRRVAA